jgi:4-hydroxy-3-methylbut-2-enyl diphosphate reductase
VDNAEHLRPEWVRGAAVVGITAGASAPEVLVSGVIARLREFGAVELAELDGVVEDVTFPLPKALQG